jgi:hypothetical protein
MNLKKKLKMTKKEKILTLVLVGILIGYGWYQVAYGSNESDYRIGYKDGLASYQYCSANHNCNVSENLHDSSCVPTKNLKLTHYAIELGLFNMGNETACNHGYFHGWIHECLKDGGGAICQHQPVSESDYEWGFKVGLGAYYECSNQSSCRPTLPEQVNTVGGYPPDQTPYAHGYHLGWVHACLNDGGWANCYGWHDGGPVIAAITGPGRCYNNTGGQTCESGNFTSIH